MDELRQAWERDGYVLLPGATSGEAPDAYAHEVAAARDGLLARIPGDDQVSLATQLQPGAPGGIVDPYARVDAARTLLLSPALVAFLTTLFGETPLLFDAAEAGAGAPDDGPHRDATFIALDRMPETLVTIAVALGDGASVALHPGSQSLETTPFSGRHRAFNVERDGEAALARHRDELAAALTGEPQTVALSAGDVLVWTAGLVHLPVSGPALVAHLCPGSVRPTWFAYRPERARYAAFADGAAWIATQYYDLVDALEPGAAPAGVEDQEELRQVAEALREHDEELAIEPGPRAAAPSGPGESAQAARRSGGLVDSVRGLINRRNRGR